MTTMKKEKGENLASLASEINKRHGMIQKSARRTLVHIIKTGILLRRVKREVGHGNFTTWVGMHCEFSMRTAELYKFVASNRKQIKNDRKQIKPEIIAGLGLNGAVKRIRELNDPAKSKNNGKKKDTDLQDVLGALNKSLVTPRQIIQRIEKKQGWLIWRRENNGMLKLVEENAVALITLLNERFSSKSRGKSK